MNFPQIMFSLSRKEYKNVSNLSLRDSFLYLKLITPLKPNSNMF